MSYVIHQGDALETLREMESESVHCCVTSPPYWGLRDYGTAQWEDGDSDCDHKAGSSYGTKSDTNAGAIRGGPFKGTCGKCGANRVDLQLGLEETPEEYVTRLVRVFAEVKRVLRSDGTLWVNLGDSYSSSNGNGRTPQTNVNLTAKNFTQFRNVTGQVAGLKPKDLVGVPWMTAFALRADGWYLRSDIVWSKSNPMPESVTDRPTKSHEYIFLLSKSPRYYFDQESVKEATVRAGDVQTFGGAKARDGQEQGGDPRNGHRADANSQWGKAIQTKATRNIRSVWTIATQPFSEAHFATFPPELIKPCILAGSPAGGVVLDPFCGSATTGVVATQWNRDFIGIELNPEYVEMGRRRIEGQNGKMALYQLIEAKERQGALLDG